MIITPEAETYRVNALYITGQSVSEPHKTLEEAENERRNKERRSGKYFYYLASLDEMAKRWNL